MKCHVRHNDGSGNRERGRYSRYGFPSRYLFVTVVFVTIVVPGFRHETVLAGPPSYPSPSSDVAPARRGPHADRAPAAPRFRRRRLAVPDRDYDHREFLLANVNHRKTTTGRPPTGDGSTHRSSTTKGTKGTSVTVPGTKKTTATGPGEKTKAIANVTSTVILGCLNNVTGIVCVNVTSIVCINMMTTKTPNNGTTTKATNVTTTIRSVKTTDGKSNGTTEAITKNQTTTARVGTTETTRIGTNGSTTVDDCSTVCHKIRYTTPDDQLPKTGKPPNETTTVVDKTNVTTVGVGDQTTCADLLCCFDSVDNVTTTNQTPTTNVTTGGTIVPSSNPRAATGDGTMTTTTTTTTTTTGNETTRTTTNSVGETIAKSPGKRVVVKPRYRKLPEFMTSTTVPAVTSLEPPPTSDDNYEY